MRLVTLFAAALACNALLALACFGSVQYTVIDLGTLRGGENAPYGSDAYGINASGQVVGWATTDDGATHHAFLYSNGKMRDLGTLGGKISEAFGINASGQVVGWAHTAGGAGHAFLYTNGGMIDLGTLGGSSSDARGINASGQIVGSALTTGNTAQHAFLYSNGIMRDLGTLGGPLSHGMAINDSGQIAGEGDIAYRAYRAMLYTDDSMINLGTLGGPDSFAYGINARGEVVGESGWEPGSMSAFVYRNGSMIRIDQGSYSCAFGINAGGQIVGFNGGHAFLYSNGRMMDLNDLLVPGTGWKLEEARAINDFGQIVGYGTNPAGKSHAFLLTPVPEPAFFGVVALGALGLLARRRSGRIPP